MPSQGANNGASQAAGSKSVTFTRQAAQRIAKAVRTIEGGNRDQPGIVFDHPQPGGIGNAKVFRVATFTGAWSINAAKTVTFKNQTATPNTVSASNLFFDFPEPSGTIDCGIAKEGTAWYVVSVPINYATAVFGEDTNTTSFVTSIDIAATLNTNDCAITVTKTVTTGEVTYYVPESTFTAQFLTFKID